MAETNTASTDPVGQPGLARRLGVGDAVVVGLSAMTGAGVFAVFAPAARAAGSLLLVGLGVAAVVAYCNATSSAQLAAQYPSSGGTYELAFEAPPDDGAETAKAGKADVYAKGVITLR